MSLDYSGHINDSLSSFKDVRIKYVIKDKVRVQVIDAADNKVIREIPHQYSSNILKNVYA